MAYKVFVDGQEGTTGLEIRDRLAKRSDLDTLVIDPERRKDPDARRVLLNEADVVFLCLPDSAARESASMVSNGRTRIIDGSTAHRIDPEWAYGLPELSPRHRESIAGARRVSVPGCHATAAVLALYPLVHEGILPSDYPVSCCSITGYSGGGRKLIEKYRSATDGSLRSPRHYALGLNHKHLPEIQRMAELDFTPSLLPIVGDFYRGLALSIPLAPRLLPGVTNASDVHGALAAYYGSERFVRVTPFDSAANLDEGYFDVEGCNLTNRADIFVFGHEEQILLMVRLDNLGKGASGAAVQCMNIMLGMDEGLGLGEPLGLQTADRMAGPQTTDHRLQL